MEAENPIPLLTHRITQAEARLAELERTVNGISREVATIKAWIIAGSAIGGTLVPIVSVVIARLWGA